MKRFIIYISLIFLLIIIFSSCESVPVIKNHELPKKYPFHVAIDANCFANCQFSDSVEGCWQSKSGNNPSKPILRSVKVNLNKIAVKVFTLGLKKLFNEVSVVYDSSDLDKKSIDLIFDIRINSASAINMKKCGAGEVKSEISFELNIEDINGVYVDSYEDYGIYKGTGGVSGIDIITGILALPTPLTTLATEGFSIQDNYYNSFYASATKAYNEVSNKLLSSNRFATFAQKIIEKKTTPASLLLDIKYSDKNAYLPNNTIDAGEKSEINVNLTNKGQGTAFDTKIIVISKYKNIKYPQNISVGDVTSNETKTVSIPLHADLNIESG